MNMVDMDEVKRQLDKAVEAHRHDVEEREDTSVSKRENKEIDEMKQELGKARNLLSILYRCCTWGMVGERPPELDMVKAYLNNEDVPEYHVGTDHVHDVKERKAVTKELASLMNKYGWDDWCNTPDYLLAEFIVDAVQAYGRTMNRNMLWHSGWKSLGSENECTGSWWHEDDIPDDAGQIK